MLKLFTFAILVGTLGIAFADYTDEERRKFERLIGALKDFDYLSPQQSRSTFGSTYTQPSRPTYPQPSRSTYPQPPRPPYLQQPSFISTQTSRPASKFVRRFEPAVDPSYRSAIDPSYRSAIDPSNGSVIDQLFGPTSNPSSGSTIDPSYGSAIDPSKGSMFDQLFGSTSKPSYGSSQYPNTPPPSFSQSQTQASAFKTLEPNENTSMQGIVQKVGSLYAQNLANPNITPQKIRLCCDDNRELTNCREINWRELCEPNKVLIERESSIFVDTPNQMQIDWSERLTRGRGTSTGSVLPGFTDSTQNTSQQLWNVGNLQSFSSNEPSNNSVSRLGEYQSPFLRKRSSNSFENKQSPPRQYNMENLQNLRRDVTSPYYDPHAQSHKRNQHPPSWNLDSWDEPKSLSNIASFSDTPLMKNQITPKDETQPRPFRPNYETQTNNNYRPPPFKNLNTWDRSPSFSNTASSGDTPLIKNQGRRDETPSRPFRPNYETQTNNDYRSPPLQGSDRWNGQKSLLDSLVVPSGDDSKPEPEAVQPPPHRKSTNDVKPIIPSNNSQNRYGVPNNSEAEKKKAESPQKNPWLPRNPLSWLSGTTNPEAKTNTNSQHKGTRLEAPNNPAPSTTNTPIPYSGNVYNDYLKCGVKISLEPEARPKFVSGRPARYPKDEPYKPLNLIDFQKQALARHNHYRIKHGLQTYEMSDNLNQNALKYAQHLVQMNIGVDRRNPYFEHSGLEWRPKSGENLAYSDRRLNNLAESVVDDWWNEIEQCSPSDTPTRTAQLTAMDGGIGHATQVLWSESLQLGCAFAKTQKTDKIPSAYFSVCHYSPAGNSSDPGDYPSNLPFYFDSTGQFAKIIEEAKLLAAHTQKITNMGVTPCPYFHQPLTSEESAFDYENSDIDGLMKRLLSEGV